MSEAMELNEDEIVDLFAHGFNRNDEEFIFHRFVNQAFLYKEFIVLVFNFRDEHGDLEETVVSIEQYLRKYPNLTSRFGYFDSGVPNISQREPRIITLPYGFGLVVPLSA